MQRDEGGSRLLEFMLVGGATLALFPVMWLLRNGVGLDASDFAVGFVTFYGAYVINDPHFAVTYLLFYQGARKRAFSREFKLAYRIRYLLAGAVVPAVLAIWATVAWSARSTQMLGWMIQLMFLLVGWHYVKQGFGVVVVLSARRGVRINARERTVILAHCFAGWAYAWASPATAAGDAPLSGFLITVWSWTIYSSIDPLMQYVIPALHSMQYLYFVWLMKRNEAREREGPPLFGRPVAVRLGTLAISALGLGWLLFRGAPGLLDRAIFSSMHHRGATAAFGRTPFFATVFVIVNIHHYFMDAVIWRRDNPDTRYLRLAHTAAD